MTSAAALASPGSLTPCRVPLRARGAAAKSRAAVPLRRAVTRCAMDTNAPPGGIVVLNPLSAMMNYLSSFNPMASAFAVTEKEKLHVHFGAGRLGFGLVLPSLESSESPYVIVNRASKQWQPVVARSREEQQHVAVQINGECSCGGRGLHVITEDDIRTNLRGINGIIADGITKGARGFLLLSMDPELCAPMIAKATSFSCALGPALGDVLVEHLMALPDFEASEARPVLYACENDHSAVEQLQFALRAKIEAIPCMVDRICVDMQVTNDGKIVELTAENFEGSIVMLGGGVGQESPFVGEDIQRPENDADSSYLYRKKLLTVNGMHTVIAFRTLCNFAASQRAFTPPEKCPALPLLSNEDITEEQRTEIWSWGVAQILVLMWEHGIPTMMRVHKQDSVEGLVAVLLERMQTTLDRFFSITDTTSRVLGGGVSTRYEGRLLPTYATVTSDIFSSNWEEGCPQEVLLQAAGLDFDTLTGNLQRLVDEARPFAAVDQRVRATKALHDAMKEELAAVQIREQQLRASAAAKVAILFDFDGTLGDTESPAMEVAFWELAPYFPNITPAQLTPTMMNDYIRLNAGKAFEFMLEKVEEDRKAAGLPPIEEVRALYSEDTAVLALVNAARAALGLAALELTREDHPSLLAKQKDETVESLRLLARPCDGVIKALNFLKISGFKYAISTTSPKPRVPVCVDTARLRDWFPDDKIHSGESDFDPPRFKPDPSVYIKAAAAEGVAVTTCIAVEDSVSGVGSAANAEIALIVGYVGASHISAAAQDGHAASLLLGAKSDNGVGADIVILDMEDLPTIINWFLELTMLDDAVEACKRGNFDFTAIQPQLRSKCWLKPAAAEPAPAAV